MNIEKTDAEAEAFAAQLADEGDAGVFRNLWARGEHAMIRGHFPAFVEPDIPLEPVDPVVLPVADESPTVAAKPATKSKK